MSVVTDLILITAVGEQGYSQLVGRSCGVKRINEHLDSHHERTFSLVREHAGGDKGFQTDTYLCAINQLDLYALLDVFHSCEWEDARYVMLLYREENDRGFTVCLPEGVPLKVNSERFKA